MVKVPLKWDIDNLNPNCLWNQALDHNMYWSNETEPAYAHVFSSDEVYIWSDFIVQNYF